MTWREMLRRIRRADPPRFRPPWRPPETPLRFFVKVLPDKDFEREAGRYGHKKSVAGFAVWRRHHPTEGMICLRCRTAVQTFGHELRHLYEGHFHEE